MNSSTSSSEARRLFLRILLAITLGLSLSMALVRLTALAFDARAETIMARVVEARAALPRILAEEEDLVLFFGSSMTEEGFAARQFDRQLAERGVTVKSFNFGFGGLNPYFQDYLSRRIRDAFQAEDRRLKLALIEFCPFQVTTSRWNGALPTVDSFQTMLSTQAELWDVTLADPTRGVRLLNIHYLRDDISAEMATSFFGRPFSTNTRPRSELPEDEEAQALLDEIVPKLNAQFAEDYPDYKSEAWSYDWQGAGTIPEERSPETLELFEAYYDARRTPRRMDDDRLQRMQCCDILDLNFEPVLIESFIRIVQNFQEFSDDVEVVLLPQNGDWIHNPPEAQARMTAVLDRIRTETGVTIRNLQGLETVTPQMYSDTTHLARYSGDVAYTAHLVELYAPRLRR